MNLHPTLDDVVEALSDAQFAVGCYLSQQEMGAPGYAAVFDPLAPREETDA